MEGEIIDYSDFQLSAIRWKNFLTPKDKPLDQLIKMDHERIYTSALFFALTSQEKFQVVVDLSKRDRAIRNKLVDLYHALSSKDLPEYVQPIAQEIKNLFFLPVVTDLLNNLSPSKTSKYMEKYMNNLVHEYKLEHQDDNEDAGVLTASK